MSGIRVRAAGRARRSLPQARVSGSFCLSPVELTGLSRFEASLRSSPATNFLNTPPEDLCMPIAFRVPQRERADYVLEMAVGFAVFVAFALFVLSMNG